MNSSMGMAVAASTGTLLTSGLGLGLGLGLGVGTAQAQSLGAVSPSDENFWGKVAAQYQVSPNITNLENGYYGIMTQSVMADYQRKSPNWLGCCPKRLPSPGARPRPCKT